MKKPVFIITFIAFVIRLAFGVIIYHLEGTSQFIDEWDYISYANNILSQGIWVPDITRLYSNSHLVGPGFPFVLASIFYVFGQNYFIVVLFNCLLSTIVVTLIYFICKETFNQKIGLIASGWAIFYILFFQQKKN